MNCGFHESKSDDVCDGKSDDGRFSCILYFVKIILQFPNEFSLPYTIPQIMNNIDILCNSEKMNKLC